MQYSLGDIAGLVREQFPGELAKGLELIGADAPGSLREAMAYSLNAPGKRLRPLLVMMSCVASGGDLSQAWGAAVAIEMVHTYSLIHDDLPAMDNDDLRRGLPTCHKKFGEALAILAGDALLTGAFHVLGDRYPGPTAAVCVIELATGSGARGMVGGQVLDLAAEGRIPGERTPEHYDDLVNIHRRKTGALFISALRLGYWVAKAASMAKANDASLLSLERYGQAFGLAFQIADDLLDVRGNSEQTGKAVGKDAAKGKLTYPGLLGVDRSQGQMKDLLQTAIEAVQPLGPRAQALIDLAQQVMDRDR